MTGFATASQSRHEIGIRIALGATPSRMVRRLMGRALVETLAGAAAGLAGAAALSGILKAQLYQVTGGPTRSPISPRPLLLTAAAAFAAYLPARRALRIDPMTALRGE